MKKLCSFFIGILLFCSCSNALDEKIALLNGRFDIDSTLEQCANKEEREALSFLYTYMPLSDMVDYDYSLYLNSVRTTFTAREEMPWGKSVPKKIFKHFVLPLRVNNENLDNAREVLYSELKDRVKGLSMYDAVLEVNHFCHEKVIYTPSDARTSSPLATMKTAYGRCGEESVFTVNALRAVGIPARQVYTPRWAHTDDNHAWVEAWVDGKWHYLGACEPAPKLDVAWFSSTAKRALLMHTKVFGKYSGKEDIIHSTDCYTEINITFNYAPTQTITITIKDDEGRRVKDAKVDFRIFNYAELYNAISLRTNSMGKVSATFALGDIFVSATKDKKWGFRKVSVGKDGSDITIFLEHSIGEPFTKNIDVIPPVGEAKEVVLTKKEVAINNLRLAREDSIRTAYTSSFATINDARNIGYLSSTRRIFKYLQSARGNWEEISKYISSLNPDIYATGLDLLDLISEKDLRDTPADILLDHINHFDIKPVNSIRTQYVLNPRIADELLTPYRGFFMNTGLNTINDITAFCRNIKILDRYNPQNIPMSPIGAYKLGATDSHSRNILFVALCRSANIPARLEEISGKLQYYDHNTWNDVTWEENSDISDYTPSKGNLMLTYNERDYIDDPQYDVHFTIAKIENDDINTLYFRDKEGYEGTTSYQSTFSSPITLDCGYYAISTGVRLANGDVLAYFSTFTITQGEYTEVPLVLRRDDNRFRVIGSLDAEDQFSLITKKGFSTSSIISCTDRGYYILAFVNNDEPSQHAIRSLFTRKPKKPVIVLFSNTYEYKKFLSLTLPPQPEGVYLGIDNVGGKNSIREKITSQLKISATTLPIIVVADTFGHLVYVSQGYIINTSEQIDKIK